VTTPSGSNTQNQTQTQTITVNNQTLPQTGAEELLASTQSFLTPFQAASSAGTSVPGILWASMSMIGVGLGGRISKRWFL
jgi:hypothetical protein